MQDITGRYLKKISFFKTQISINLLTQAALRTIFGLLQTSQQSVLNIMSIDTLLDKDTPLNLY